MVRCARCGRILTDPLSIQRGYGPECIEAINVEIDLMQQPPQNAIRWLCETCGRPVPGIVMHKGQCPACWYDISLAQQDVEPFAEVG